MELSSCFRIGQVIGPHGIKGAMTLYLNEEAPDLTDVETLFAEKNGRLIPLFLQQVSLKGNRAYVQFDGITSIEKAEVYKKCDLYLPKSLRPELAEGEFYPDELVGYEVIDDRAGVLGSVKTISQMGLNRLIVVERPENELLIPVNGPFITTIDPEKKRVLVSLPDGYLDI